MGEASYVALLDDEGIVEQLALFTDYAVFYRDSGDWMPIAASDDDDVLSGLTPVDTTSAMVPLFDMAESTDATLVRSDIPSGA